MNIRFMKWAVAAATAALFVGCKTGDFTYDGPDYLMFSDTLYRYGVQESNEIFNVQVSATRPADYDRTFGVEIVDRRSNAVEGRHYRLLASTVTLPAGEMAVDVPVQGIYEHIGVSDSLGFELNLVIPDEKQWPHYGTQTKVLLQKVCPPWRSELCQKSAEFSCLGQSFHFFVGQIYFAAGKIFKKVRHF